MGTGVLPSAPGGHCVKSHVSHDKDRGGGAGIEGKGEEGNPPKALSRGWALKGRAVRAAVTICAHPSEVVLGSAQLRWPPSPPCARLLLCSRCPVLVSHGASI